jgi:hypothetical protein
MLYLQVWTNSIDVIIRIRTQNNYDDVQLYRTTTTVFYKKNKAMMIRKDNINNTVVKIFM